MEKENVNFLYKTMVERDPQKRKVKPVQNPLLDFDLGESSDDSDFRIEDHETDDDDDSMCSGDEIEAAGGGGSGGSSDSSDDEAKFKSAEGSTKTGSPSVGELLAQAKQQMQPGASTAASATKLLICCACLGDRSDAINEIVECDGCGVTVHEACYGVSDTASVSSTISSCSTEPWFCEACKAGVTNPDCELCPNHGGIFKETDVGKWVHLVCALYVPGVAFGEVDKLSNVTLFEMQYTKWGGKACQLCEDQRFVRTGVCIGCDAGMCRTVFHVTCAQREGLLAEAHCDELEHADPFYAHCRLHTDKVLMRKRRRNWLAVQLRMHERQAELERKGSQNESPEQQRIKRKLLSHRSKYLAHKGTRVQPWVPTQKMPRLLTTSASACRKLIRKAELMGVDCKALETQEAQVASLIDVRKKWHIPPAFSVEFIGYYLDRNIRITAMKRRLEESLKTNSQYLKRQQILRSRYDQLVKEKKELQQHTDQELNVTRNLRQTILAICPGQKLPPEPSMVIPPAVPAIPTPFVYAPHPTPSRRESKHHRQESLTLNECGICRQTKDQHLLAKCDTCHRYYHLGCLNPPLTRMPKKTKLMGWQCSECDKESTGSEPECPDPEAPRKLRYSQGDAPTPTYRHFDPSEPYPQLIRQPMVSLTPIDMPATVPTLVLQASRLVGTKGSIKRRHKHQHRTGPHGEKHKRRRKKKHLAEHPRIKITIKPILPPSDQAPPTQQMFVTSNPTPSAPAAATAITAAVPMLPAHVMTPTTSRARRPSNRPEPDVMSRCDTCLTEGTNQNLVRCDECRKCFHFHCLEPPVKKSPKRRGYSWHCADCDPTDSDHSNKH